LSPSPTEAADEVSTASSCSAEGVWVPMGSDNVPSPRTGATHVWTGSTLIIWGGSDVNGISDTGGRYDPAIDAWLPVSTANAPAARQEHVAVWTGSRMIVWGGYGTTIGSPVSGGGLYDPLTDTWTAMDTSNAPSSRREAEAVW